eukprot:1140949-Pelagomonas_calceolata.AAC.2
MENLGWGPLDGLLTGGRDVWLDGWLTTHWNPLVRVGQSSHTQEKILEVLCTVYCFAAVGLLAGWPCLERDYQSGNVHTTAPGAALLRL